MSNNYISAHILSTVMLADNKNAKRVATKLVKDFKCEETIYESEMGAAFGDTIMSCANGLNTETAVFCASVMVKYFAIKAADHKQEIEDKARLIAKLTKA